MERLQGFARIPATGAPALNCTITVYETGTGTPATLYDDNLAAPTPKANPFQSSAVNGFWFCYAAAGRYDVQFSGGEIPAGQEYVLADVPSGPADGGIPTYAEASLPATSAPHRGRLALVTSDVCAAAFTVSVEAVEQACEPLESASRHVQFTYTIVGGVAPFTYELSWTGGGGGGPDLTLDPIVTFTDPTLNLVDELIPFTLVVTDATLATASYGSSILVTFCVN